MAGTGDLESLQFIRSLYFKVDNEVTYGNHSATQLAIGILFLGYDLDSFLKCTTHLLHFTSDLNISLMSNILHSGGDLTFGRSNDQIASLLISLFPFFPCNPNDNRYHLQALRQLYVMATEARSLVTLDAATGQPVFCPIKVTTEKKVVCAATRPNVSEVDSFDKTADSFNSGSGFQGDVLIESRDIVAPCLLTSDRESIVRVQITSER